MKKRLTSLLVAASLSLGLGQDGLFPFDDFYVSVDTSERISGSEYGERLEVDVTLSKRSETPAEGATSVKVRCSEFPSGSTEFTSGDLKVFSEACAAAIAGKPFKAELQFSSDFGSGDMLIEVTPEDKLTPVRVVRDTVPLLFAATEGARIEQAIQEARVGEAWFKKIMNAKVRPEAAEDARPPKANNYFVSSTIGKVSCGEFDFEVELMAFAIRNQRSQYQVSHALRFGEDKLSSSGGGWVEELLAKAAEALSAVEQGKDFSFQHSEQGGGGFTVSADLSKKEAVVIFTPDDFFRDKRPIKGRINQERLAEIRKLIAESEVRMKWFQDHEDLFFTADKPKKK